QGLTRRACPRREEVGEEGGMSNQQKTHSPMEAIRQWYRGLARSQSALANCGAEGLERMAHDVGMSSAELCRQARGRNRLIFCLAAWKRLTLTRLRLHTSSVPRSRICSGFAACATARSDAPAILRVIPPIRPGRITARMRRR